MAIKKSQLYSTLWESCNALRGGMDASQYKDYVLVVLFVKYISDRAKSGDPDLEEIPAGCTFDDFIALKHKDQIGDEINKKLAKLASTFGLDNVFVNADFESDASGEFGGWKIPATGVWKIVDGAGRNGTRALVYETEDPDAKYAWVTQRVAVEGGRTYAYETWILGKDIRCDMQGATMFLSWRDKDGKPGEHWGMGAVRGSNGDWSKCGAVARIPEGVSEVTVNLILRNHSVGRACFDDVLVRPLASRMAVVVGTTAYRNVVSDGRVTLKAILNIDEGKHPLGTLAATFTTVADPGTAAFVTTSATVKESDIKKAKELAANL